MSEEDKAKYRCTVIMEQMREAEDRVAFLKDKWETALTEWQAVCSHSYARECNGDYHRPRYYYSCRLCGHFSATKPT